MAIGSSLFKKRESRPDGFAWIGLDFGTATTECVIRIELPGEPDKVAVLAFDGRTRSDAKIILPTAMEILDDSILPSYLLTGRGHIVETVKTKLIAEIDEGSDAAMLRRPCGPFSWTMLHLTSVLAVARSAISRWMGRHRLNFYLNIAAPVSADPDNPRDAKIREVFREVAYRALVLSSDWHTQPLTKSEALAVFKMGMGVPLPAIDASPVVSVPEALAGVTSFLHAPDRRAGNYTTIDVGGGTTDISFFWFQTGEQDLAHERKAWYYSVRTMPVGTNDLIAGLQATSDASNGRTAHERLRDLDNPSGHIHRENLDGFLFGLNTTYKEAFREAFRLRRIHKDWCLSNRARWTLLLLGGGCGFPFVQEHLKSTPPENSNIQKHGDVVMLRAPH